ncbi:MAG: hypothetical protein LKE33_06525 [Acidaminococcus sp.]|jgi:hypothetical protein|nr:hypothetical protein [Acidaminococcus sp.]MCI2100381.1 hypothetical protein [Acidaminococcus sp.]MCI2114702.1 hypothetical protein [Acidaminococcus sp.]MCI2116723.1 hypothetical protein [Acidaminococcus sp.]
MDLFTFLFIAVILMMIQSSTQKKKKRVPPKPQQPIPQKTAKKQPLNPHIREALERFENRMKSQSQPQSQSEPSCAGPTISDEPLHTTEKDEIHPINPTVKEDLTTLSTSVKEDLKPQVAEAPEPGESSETKPRTRSRRSKVREGIIWSVILERKY